MPKPDHSANEEKLMRRYLLGELNETDQLAFEERFFGDDDSYQLVLAIEDELRYDYAQGVLPAAERKRFEQRLLPGPGGTERVRLAKAVLDETLARAGRELASQPLASPSKSWWSSLWAMPRLAFVPATAAVAIIGSSYCLWEVYQVRSQMGELDAQLVSQRRAAMTASLQQNGERQKLSQEIEKERQRRVDLEKELSQRPQTRQPYLAFLLAPGLSRDVAGPRKLVLAPGVETVQLDLELKQAGFARYRVELQNLDGALLWSENARPSGQRLQLVIPARILRAGDYMLEVKGTTAAGAIEPAGDYYFTFVLP